MEESEAFMAEKHEKGAKYQKYSPMKAVGVDKFSLFASSTIPL